MLHFLVLLVLHAGVLACCLRLVVRGRRLVPLVVLLLLLLILLGSIMIRRLVRVASRLQTIGLVLSPTRRQERIRRRAGVQKSAVERILLRSVD